LIIPLGLALLLVRAASRDQLWMVGLFTLGPVGALFLSASRAGIFTFFLQFAFLAVLVWTRSLGRHRMAVAATLLLAGTVFVAWLGVEQALARFGQLSKSVLPIRSRLIMAKDTWRIFLDHPWIGTGWGTFISVYPQYASDYFGGNLVNHAHNDYLEILAETGVVGALTCVALLALLFWLGLARLSSHHEPFALAGRLGALTACFGLLLHGFVDFNFYIPSNALLFLLLAGLATAPHCRPEDGPSQSRTTRREPLLGGRLS
jgi:O-antigen ligase